MSTQRTKGGSDAVERGRRAVADALAAKVHWLQDDERAMDLARTAIDAWLRASNPVGEPETIYDEFYRLRDAIKEHHAAIERAGKVRVDYRDYAKADAKHEADKRLWNAAIASGVRL